MFEDEPAIRRYISTVNLILLQISIAAIASSLKKIPPHISDIIFSSYQTLKAFFFFDNRKSLIHIFAIQ